MPKVTIYNGESRKDKKPFKAVRVEVGEWSQLIFPRSSFELSYIEQQLIKENKLESEFNLDED